MYHTLIRLAVSTATASTWVAATATAAHAADPIPLAVNDLPTVVANLTAWVTGILAALATLFLTIGGARYLMAGGDPAEVERAKGSLKSAGIGYALALGITLQVIQVLWRLRAGARHRLVGALRHLRSVVPRGDRPRLGFGVRAAAGLGVGVVVRLETDTRTDL
jgi:hypothetical protein